MIEIIVVQKENGRAFMPLLTPEAQEMFACQYLTPEYEDYNKTFFVLGLVIDKEVCGALSLYFEDASTAVINSLFMREEYRRTGYATEMIIAASQFVQENEMCQRLEITVPVFHSSNNHLAEFFDYLEFEKETTDYVGSFTTNLSALLDNPIFFKANTNSVLHFKDLTSVQISSLADQAYGGLDEMYAMNMLETDISCFYCMEKEITDCMIFAPDSGGLRFVWADTSPTHPTAFVELLSSAIQKASLKYDKDLQISIPYINKTSYKLIKKLLGDKAKPVESYVKYWIDLDAPF